LGEAIFFHLPIGTAITNNYSQFRIELQFFELFNFAIISCGR
jgi:hypothetical protein